MSEHEKIKPCDDCANDPVGILKRFFVDRVEGNRIRLGQNPALRPVFSKTHGVVHGVFEPRADLAPQYRVGVLAESRPLTAWIRFSSDIQPSDADLKQTCGIGIKLFDVKGKKLVDHGDTQDFVLQNHDVFMVDDAVGFCRFIQDSLTGTGDFLKKHPETRRIQRDMMKVESSLLSATYWSALPYAFGDRAYVKYKLTPRLRLHSTPPDDPSYLKADLIRRLRREEAAFDFCIQLQLDPSKQPLDQATVRWAEKDTPPIPVATLTLPRQDAGTPGQSAYGENLLFHPWHSIEAHRPEGSIARARREVYSASAALRRQTNGIPANEPGDPRSPGLRAVDPSAHIVHAAIYPPIGVARVGNSPQEWFFGPELPDPKPEDPGFYRDASGALKRQAARFRIYGLNEAGVAVKELTANDAVIEWTVYLANTKAAWYGFQLALDIPEAGSAAPTVLRNAAIADRESLKIKPKHQTISGKSRGKRGTHAFKDGKFMGSPVYLGEVRTDDDGRLIVLGGHGVSKSPSGARTATFANNEGWYDDTSDGPVTAKVTYQGQVLQVDPAWVVVAPPNYAPRRKSVRTMWDLMRDTAISANKLARPVRPSFERDIRTIFERLSGLQWVNAGFAASFGWRGPNDFTNPQMLQILSSVSPIHAELRRTIANQFRVFDRDSLSPQPWPWIWGDAMNAPPLSPRAFTVLTPTQIAMLQQWAAGDFVPDYDPKGRVRDLIKVPDPDQPDMLTRAAMEFCLADAFHPGSEMTWPMRHYSMYMSPFRIDHAPHGTVEPDFGEVLTTAAFPSKQGPLGQQFPGGLTRWLGVPWQTDAASCDSGYDGYDPYLPSFWPAHVPNQVITEEHYRTVMDTKLPLEDRLAAFTRREDWLRILGSAYIDKINHMVDQFPRMGIIEPRKGPGDADFPAEMEVESLAPSHESLPATPHPRDPGQSSSQPATPAEQIEKKKRFVHGLRQ